MRSFPLDDILNELYLHSKSQRFGYPQEYTVRKPVLINSRLRLEEHAPFYRAYCRFKRRSLTKKNAIQVKPGRWSGRRLWLFVWGMQSFAGDRRGRRRPARYKSGPIEVGPDASYFLNCVHNIMCLGRI